MFFCGNKTQPEQMKRRPLCILTALTAALLSGCEKEHSPSPEFIGNDDIALVIQGSTKIKYIPETFQIGFNADRRQFRIHNDTMSEYYILTCSSMPEREGEKIKCTLKYVINGKPNFKNLTFEVVKTDASGIIWLWNAKKEIGLTVKAIYPQDYSSSHKTGNYESENNLNAASLSNSNDETGDRKDSDKNDGATPPDGKQTTVKHCLIIPAEFQDVPLKSKKEWLEKLLNGENGIQKYFDDQFLGEYEFHFHLADPVTLSRKRAYYGKNLNGKDRFEYLAAEEACQIAHEKGVDFSQFDGDGDGLVDNVFVIVAGEDESDGGEEDCIWSHAGKLSDFNKQFQLDGKTIDSYAITSELRKRKNGILSSATIGVFCHEYSHTLGLKDMYDTDASASGGLSSGLWKTTSLMDNGHLNNEGRTPAGYNAIDRDMLGIGKPEELKPGKYTLEPISKSGRYLTYHTENEGEYYLIECRANTGWDRYIEGHGLAIYHIDKSSSKAGFSSKHEKELTAEERWKCNEVNSNPSHECAKLITANQSASETSEIFWPYRTQNSFTPKTIPAFKSWDGTASRLAIVDIMQAGDNVEFTVKPTGGIAIPKATITRKDVFQNTAIIQWESDIQETGLARVKFTTKGPEIKNLMVNAYSPGKYALRLEGLKASYSYNMRIFYTGESDASGKETEVSFTTKRLYEEGYPFIYFNDDSRKTNGTFKENAEMPLIVFNMNNFQSVSWFMDGRSIVPSADGYYYPNRTCTLTAKITGADGSTDYIIKEIIIKP